MLRDIIHIVTIIIHRLYDFVCHSVILTGLSAVMSPVGFTIGLVITLWLATHFHWYVHLLMWSWLAAALVYVLSHTYRNWLCYAVTLYFNLVEEKYP